MQSSCITQQVMKSVLKKIRFRLETYYLSASSKIIDRMPLRKIVKWDSNQFVLLTENLYERNNSSFFFQKEKYTVEWVKKCFRQGDIVFDVGANVGHITLFISKQFRDDIDIYAIEPSYTSFNKLKENLIINSCHNVRAFNLAFSDTNEIGEFFYKNIGPGRAQHTISKKMNEDGIAFDILLKDAVLVLTLDTFIDLFNIPFPNHVKLDVDGAEDIIMQGMKKVLANENLRSVNIEITGKRSKHEAILSELKFSGFELFQENVHNNNEFYTSDYYLTRQETNLD